MGEAVVRLIWKMKSLHARWAIRSVSHGAPRFLVTSAPTLVVAPHQDDETLGCGGLIAEKRRLGCPLHVMILTDGRLGGKPEGRAAEIEARIALRNVEAKNAMVHLAVEVDHLHFMGCRDGGLREETKDGSQNLSKRVAEFVKSHAITEVFVTHSRDGHPDHAAAFSITQQAMKSVSSAARLIQYPVWMWWSLPFSPRARAVDMRSAAILPLGDHGIAKQAALACYASQTTRFPSGFMHSLMDGPEIFFQPAS